MNSVVTEPLLTIRIDRELLRFDHPDQWRECPVWRERIKLSSPHFKNPQGAKRIAAFNRAIDTPDFPANA